MTSEIKDILENMTTAAPEMEDYIGEDGLLYCGKCHTPKEAYFPEGKELFGRDRHPAECDCQRAAREQRQAAEEHRRHVEAVENLKQRAFADSAIQEEDSAEVNEMVRTAKVTPEQLAALLRQSATTTPTPAALSAVGATFNKEDDSNEDDE